MGTFMNINEEIFPAFFLFAANVNGQEKTLLPLNINIDKKNVDSVALEFSRNALIHGKGDSFHNCHEQKIFPCSCFQALLEKSIKKAVISHGKCL